MNSIAFSKVLEHILYFIMMKIKRTPKYGYELPKTLIKFWSL